ncbi:hypothetical protein CYMTET_11274 [Cymbomonas tetramitiformis]|uniref:EF-hand domain-containing protein n=1 Tax=Cymbomonas tetramitiformis TaxID=36881 RepID=A0AAE0LDM0_9CHLO|nr:hypothetical protein CYMTET_11274 [Cymbomonas tetramitiformis]
MSSVDSPSRSPPTTPKRDAPTRKPKAASTESTPNRPTSARYIRSPAADLVHRSSLPRPASAHPATTKQSTPKRRPSTAHSTSRYSSPLSQGATRASVPQAAPSGSYRSYLERPQSAHRSPSKKWTDLGEEHTRVFHDVPIVKSAMEFNKGPKALKPSVPKFRHNPSKADEDSNYLANEGRSGSPLSKSGEAERPRPSPNPEKVTQTIKALALAQSIGIGKKQLRGIERSTGLSVTDLTDLLWRFQKGYQASKKTAFMTEEKEPGVKEIGPHEFHEIMVTYGITDQRAIEHLFNFFDKDRDNTMSFYEFSEVVGKLRNGSDMEKAKLLFNLYNIRNNNDMTAKELTFMLYASPSPPNQEELSHMMTAIWNLLDEDRSGRIDRKEFEEGLVKRPLVMEFLNRWFVEPQLLREDNDKTNITAKNEFLDRKSWNLNTFDIGKRLGLDMGNEEVYEWNETLYTNNESSPSAPNTKRPSVARARRAGSQIATSSSPKTVRNAMTKITERLRVRRLANAAIGT